MRNPLATKSKEELQVLYSTMTSGEIAKRFGINVSTVRRTLKRHGIEIKPPGSTKRSISKPAIDTLIELYSKYGIKRIAKKLNIPHRIVRDMLIEAGIEIRSTGGYYERITNEKS